MSALTEVMQLRLHTKFPELHLPPTTFSNHPRPNNILRKPHLLKPHSPIPHLSNSSHQSHSSQTNSNPQNTCQTILSKPPLQTKFVTSLPVKRVSSLQIPARNRIAHPYTPNLRFKPDHIESEVVYISTSQYKQTPHHSPSTSILHLHPQAPIPQPTTTTPAFITPPKKPHHQNG
ncbi:hypothetical protein BJ508DRAFT_414292 [Ascobolus immersus RN42]|uniref:Uncharacterized protein n=1 Tax=Ascobolus immersus RN42 TaxID=1160509 RepID=A0A3N4I847_ASCIM|nr:hypothetical protein BJ508DRAFT_414292 [Ascobolus immersus RN42]